MGVAGWLAWSVSPVPWGVVAFGRQTASLLARVGPGHRQRTIPDEPGDAGRLLHLRRRRDERLGRRHRDEEGVRSFHGAGKVQASTEPADMRLQRMLGHISALVHEKPESVLVVACGAGVTAGSFVLHPTSSASSSATSSRWCRPSWRRCSARRTTTWSTASPGENPHTVNGKQVEVVYDDGRHFLRTTREKFDIITSDPIDPWVKGCAALNTVEYYQMCSDHLNPGGSVSLWIPLYESNLDTTKSVIATFFKVFPNGILWSNDTTARATTPSCSARSSRR